MRHCLLFYMSKGNVGCVCHCLKSSYIRRRKTQITFILILIPFLPFLSGKELWTVYSALHRNESNLLYVLPSINYCRLSATA